MKRRGVLFLIVLLYGSPAWAETPASIFEGFWSGQCLDQQGGLVSEYSVFKDNEWCFHIVDDWRTHSICQEMKVEPLVDGAAILDVEGMGRYRAEWTGKKLVFEPLDGGEPYAFAPAVRRKDEKERFLTCPD